VSHPPGPQPTTSGSPWPTELRLNPAKDVLTVSFDNGESFALAAEYLRVESPSAEVQGHGPGQRQIVGGKRRVTISALQPVGHYAVRIVFADGHDTGLFSWAYLRELGRGHREKWPAYLEMLTSQGLKRD
jgi:DUF971 family protein